MDLLERALLENSKINMAVTRVFRKKAYVAVIGIYFQHQNVKESNSSAV